MKTDTKKHINEYIASSAPVSIKNIVDKFWLSSQIIHRHVKELLNLELVTKRGTPPVVYYFPFVSKDNENQDIISFNLDQKKILEKNFILFNADWVKYSWIKAFQQRCKIRSLNPNNEIIHYTKILNKYSNYKNSSSLIDWMSKIKNTFDAIYLDEIWYIDFYSIEKYGKTALWNLVLYAKQSWDIELIKEVANKIDQIITKLIKTKKINKCAIIPHSIDRKIQFLPKLLESLNLNIPTLNIIKIFADKIVAQKSLSKINERITNAKDTIFLTENQDSADTVLLIDDAVGSWASLNETAKKVKDKWLAKKVIWLSIVWSFKWFEVIKEA